MRNKIIGIVALVFIGSVVGYVLMISQEDSNIASIIINSENMESENPIQPTQHKQVMNKSKWSNSRTDLTRVLGFVSSRDDSIDANEDSDEFEEEFEEGRRADYPELEDALVQQDPDPEWQDSIIQEIDKLVVEDPNISVDDVKCVSDFCRIKLTKPIYSILDWPEIDDKLVHVTVGEKLFKAVPSGDMTTAYIYFSGKETMLPL